MLISLLQKRIRLNFDKSDEEMMELLASVPSCLTTATGQPSKAEDIWVRHSELVDSGARGLRQPLRLLKGLQIGPLGGWIVGRASSGAPH